MECLRAHETCQTSTSLSQDAAVNPSTPPDRPQISTDSLLTWPSRSAMRWLRRHDASAVVATYTKDFDTLRGFPASATTLRATREIDRDCWSVTLVPFAAQLDDLTPPRKSPRENESNARHQCRRLIVQDINELDDGMERSDPARWCLFTLTWHLRYLI